MAQSMNDDLVDALYDLYAVGGNKLVERAAIEHETLLLVSEKLYRAVHEMRIGRGNQLIVDEAMKWFETITGKTV